MDNAKSYPFLSLSGHIKEICRPLSDINTTCLVFVRRYTDGSEVCLSNDPRWIQYFYDNQLYKNLILDKKIPEVLSEFKPIIYPWTQFEDSKVRIEQSKYFGVGIGLTIEYPREDHVDFFYFGAKNEREEMKELYPSYQDYLFRFVQYFYGKTNKFLDGENAKQYLITVPDHEPYSGILNLKSQGSHDKICNFIKQTKSSAFLLNSSRKGNIMVTKREAECLYYLARGFTASQIADKWVRSVKTVEKTIENIKTKLGIEKGETKKDLITEAFPLIFELLSLGFYDKE